MSVETTSAPPPNGPQQNGLGPQDEVVAALEPEARWNKSTAIKILGALAGLAITAFMVAELGLRELGRAMAPALVTLPICFACEIARIGLETLATRSALGPWAERVTFGQLYRIHVVTYAVAQVLPMPRPAAEATKAALLAPYGVPIPAAASSGATLQSATFLSVGAMSTLCAWFVGPSSGAPLRAVLLGNAVLLLGLGVGLRALVRSKRATLWLGRRIRRLEVPLAVVHRESQRGPLVSPVPAAFLGVGMLLNVVELAVVGHAMGVAGGVRSAFAAFGAQLVAATVAVAVPGQVGAREAAFSLAAGALGTTALLAAGISTFTHGVQLVVAMAGFVVLFALRAGSARTRTRTQMAPHSRTD